MDIADLIEQLQRPRAYPFEVDEVAVHQTHMSVVFLAGERAYKLKKPVDFEFVDYGTLSRRRHFCRREVELNRRLAPTVYLGVVPVVEQAEGLAFAPNPSGGEPADREVVEWAVEMRRLPDERTLGSLVARGEAERAEVVSVGRRVATFHDQAASGPEISACARFEQVATNARDNYEQSREQIGTTVHSGVFARLERLNEQWLRDRRELIEARAERDLARDTHGDLRLDHVYLFDDDPIHPDLVIIDCIEFNDAFRFADPVADMAFVAMDLEVAGRRDLARAYIQAYFEARNDEQGRRLVDFYVGYRAAVRGKVEGMKATEPEVPPGEKSRARDEAMAHWLLALGRLAEPERRPALVLVAGLPATGKSTIARCLAERADFEVVDSDRVRKRLAGLDPEADASSTYGQGIYTDAWSDRTYAECRRRAENILFAGGRAIVDATFHRAARRRRFAELADAMGVPLVFVECTTPRELVAERMAARSGDVSDADLDVYDRMHEQWEEYDEGIARRLERVSTAGPVDASVERIVDLLADRGLSA